MKWTHPQLGEIREMNPRQQEVKGWKHLYEPQERWEQLTGTPASRLHSQARANACPEWRPPADRHPQMNRTCQDCLFRHHERLWRTAYGDEIMATRELIGVSRRGGRPTVLATPRGVWIVLSTPGGDRVFDAYRPHPPGRGVTWEEGDFADQARWRYEQETGNRMTDRSPQLRREILRPADAWHLALAIGAARAAGRPEELEAVRAAEARLAGLTPEFCHQALPERADLLDVVERALLDAEDDLDQATSALLSAEDALVGTEILIGQRAAEELGSVLGELSAWAPERWLGLEALVSARRSETIGVARDWWDRVDEVLSGLMVRGVEVVHAPHATLAAKLTAPPWWHSWAETLAGLGSRVAAANDPAALGWHLAAAQLADPDGVWDIVAGASIPAGAQVFVVDQDHPGGENVTDDVAEGGPFWQLEQAGQEAWIVGVEGVGPSVDLAGALRAVLQNPGASVTVLRVSRPR